MTGPLIWTLGAEYARWGRCVSERAKPNRTAAPSATPLECAWQKPPTLFHYFLCPGYAHRVFRPEFLDHLLTFRSCLRALC